MNTNLYLIGFFFPVIGLAITITLAIFFQGLKRWIVLFVAPLATVLVTFLFIRYGDYGMGALIPVILTTFFVMGLMIYYPVLIVWAIVAWRKNKKKINSDNSDLPIPKPQEQQ